MTEEEMRKIALDMIRLPTNEAVIKENHIAKKTFYDLQKDHEFKEILAAVRGEIWENAVDDVLNSTKDAVKVLVSIMNNFNVPPSARIKAANSILNRGSEWYENVRILDRIEVLEDRANIDEE